MIRRWIVGKLEGTNLEPFARTVLRKKKKERRPANGMPEKFDTSSNYWDTRYQLGGTSGSGSYGRLAELKAEVINNFVETNNVLSVIEFGSGDGNQLTLARYPAYLGLDVSKEAVAACQARFQDDPSKRFGLVSDRHGETAELSMSLDVVYHLVEDAVFHSYMADLFNAATRFVIVYSSDKEEQTPAPHVRHRKFTNWVSVQRPDFQLHEHIPNRYPFDVDDPNNTSFADFFVFAKIKAS